MRFLIKYAISSESLLFLKLTSEVCVQKRNILAYNVKLSEYPFPVAEFSNSSTWQFKELR